MARLDTYPSNDPNCFPGRENSVGVNQGFDYGSLPGWALEYSAAPAEALVSLQGVPEPISPLVVVLLVVAALRRGR